MSLSETQSLYSKDVVILLLLKTEQFLPHMTQVIWLGYLVTKEVILALNYSFSCSHTKLYIYYRLMLSKEGIKALSAFALLKMAQIVLTDKG